jgi:hypothetical protein
MTQAQKSLNFDFGIVVGFGLNDVAVNNFGFDVRFLSFRRVQPRQTSYRHRHVS